MLLLLSLAAITVLGVLLFRPAFTPRLRHGLATLEQVRIGGVDQWIMIRSQDPTNPVLLFVHGGPGTSQLTLMRHNTKALEAHFTVVSWDQRGAGKSYRASRDASHMNVSQFVDDVIELTQYLEARFHQPKITLAGHSWGSAISVLAVQRRPDLFNAYIGIGQVSDMVQGEQLSWEWALQQAKAANDQRSVKQLMAGPPPYSGEGWRAKFLTERRILGKYGGEFHARKIGAFGVVLKNLIFSTEYTLVDRINFFRGIFHSLELLMPEFFNVNLVRQAPQLAVPVYFMLGRHDYEVPSLLAEKYFAELKAPKKSLFWFENSAHMPNTEERDRFNDILLHSVLPEVAAHAH